jgi:glutamate formiminotransferase/formiminotetrahydrofolate cyclodeaminase
MTLGANNMIDQKSTLEDFLNSAAAKQPTPGGGSVAALAGALAAAMGEMAVNYSVGKKGLEEHSAELKEGLQEYQRARNMLMELMREDQWAYEALSEVKKLPDGQEKIKAHKEAVLACIRIPQSMAATALSVLNLAQQLTDRVNLFLLSDLAVCAELAMTTVRCSLYNVRVNLVQVPDAEERKKIDAEAGQILARATALVQKTIPAIWSRLKSSETQK